MTGTVQSRLRESAPDVSVDEVEGIPRVSPDSADGVATVLGVATAEGWTVRVEGGAGWMPADASADLVLSTAGLSRVRQVAGPDLMATVEAGVTLETLDARLCDAGLWLPWDPPGSGSRTIGSVIATGTAGPLRHGFGPIRDALLGCTIVTGDGRVLRPGGRVVKNVAGYDLTRLMAGGFGAFGVVTEVHLRLRARPAADRTLVSTLSRAALTSAARDLIAVHAEPDALELVSPGVTGEADWLLAARSLGPAPVVADALGQVKALTPGLAWRELETGAAPGFWHRVAGAFTGGSTTLRLGVLPDDVEKVFEVLREQVDLGLVSAGLGGGGVRWCGEASGEAIASLRRLTAPFGVSVTVERAPWPVRREVGHTGASPDGVTPLVDRLRDVFDPARTFVVPLEGETAS